MLAQISDGKLQLGGLFDGLKIDSDKYQEVIDSFKQLNINSRRFTDKETGKIKWDKIAKSIKGCDKTALSYFKTLEDGNGTINNQSASVEGLGAHLKAAGQSFNFAAIKTTLLNTALNAGIFLAASLTIQGIANAFSNYIHRVENARKRTAELFDEFKEMNDTLADHKKTVAELADRYDELSKGVNLSNNKNISLSADDYEEFLNINEQLADSFPELTKGIDDNGNSILTLGTKGITAREQLEDLLKTEENLNNFRIAQGLEDAFKGVYTYIEDANKATNTLNDSLSSANESIEALRELSENGIDLQNTERVIRGSGRSIRRENLIYSGVHGNKADQNYINILKASANDFFETLSEERRSSLNGRYALNPQNLFDIQTDSYHGTFEIYARLLELTDDEIASLQSIIEDNISSATSEMKDEIDDQLQQSQESIRKAENAWRDFMPSLVAGMKSKNTFKDLDADLQDIAIKIVEGLDTSYAAAMDAYDPDPYAYIRDKLIVPMSRLSDADKKDVQDAFASLMTLDANDISDKNREEITKLIQTIDNILEIDDLNIKVALGFDVGDDIKNRLENSIRQITDDHGLSDRDEYADLSEYTKDFTAAQAKLWFEATLGAENATQAIEMYEAALAAAKDVAEHSSPLSITETIDRLNTRLRPALESLGAAYRDIFTESGFTLKNVDISMLDSIRSAIEDLNSMEDVAIHIDYDSFDELARVLTDPASGEEQVHDAINRLATDIVGSMTPAISECSEENYRLMQSLLESMGIANAEALLISELGYSYEEYENAKKAAERAGISLNDAVAETCLALLQEKEISEEDARALIDYYIQKALASGSTIYTLDTVNELINEYEQLGLNCDKLREYRDLLRRSNTDEHGHYEGGSTYGLGGGNYEPVGYTPKAPKETVEVTYAADAETKKGTSGSTPDTFDWTTTAIDHVEKEIEALDQVANSAYSTFSQKNEALAQEIGKVSEEIDLQQQAYANYINRAEAVGLSDHYKNLIQNGSLGMEDITDEALQNRISEYQKWYDKAQETQDKINDLYQRSNDLHVTSYENCVKELETLRDSQAITEREYLDRMNVLWEKYYANQIEYAVQAKEAKLKLLGAEKDYLESVANAAADILGEQADELKNRQESEIELLEAKKKPLKDQLELLEEQKDKEDRILALQKAQYELKRAESQRSKLTYVDGQMKYRVDETNIRDAKEAVDDAEYNIVKADIQDRINAYDKEIAKINERYETEIANIERLENEWQNALALQERAQNSVNFESMFGEGSIAKLLAGDLSMVNTWKQAYLHTLGAIDMVSSGAVGEITAGYAELAGLDLSNIEEQTSAVASQFNSANDAVNRLSTSLGFKPANGTADGTSPAQAQTEGHSPSLAGALQNTYDIAAEVLPEEVKMMNAITEATNTAIAAINELKSTIESLSTVSANISGMPIYGNAYASGTKRAEKGLALVGEEKPEVILTNDKKAVLAKQPTLLNMEGGETVFDGDATAKMLKAKGFRPVTADEFPLLKTFRSYSPDEIRQKFAPSLTAPAASAASSAMQNANHAVNHSSVNNGPSYTTGDVHIHCPGITKDEVAKQIGTELTNVFSGLSLKAYQRANITR